MVGENPIAKTTVLCWSFQILYRIDGRVLQKPGFAAFRQNWERALSLSCGLNICLSATELEIVSILCLGAPKRLPAEFEASLGTLNAIWKGRSKG